MQTINATSVFINEACVYKNEGCICIIKAFVYSLQTEKRNFIIRGMQLCDKKKRTFLLIDDGRSGVQFCIHHLFL